MKEQSDGLCEYNNIIICHYYFETEVRKKFGKNVSKNKTINYTNIKNIFFAIIKKKNLILVPDSSKILNGAENVIG